MKEKIIKKLAVSTVRAYLKGEKEKIDQEIDTESTKKLDVVDSGFTVDLSRLYRGCIGVVLKYLK